MLLYSYSAKRINYKQMSSIEQSKYVTTIYDNIVFICVTQNNVRVLSNHKCALLVHQRAFGVFHD